MPRGLTPRRFTVSPVLLELFIDPLFQLRIYLMNRISTEPEIAANCAGDRTRVSQEKATSFEESARGLQ